MKKLLLILFCSPIIYGCQQKVEEYNQSQIIQADTLDIQRMKIKTH